MGVGSVKKLPVDNLLVTLFDDNECETVRVLPPDTTAAELIASLPCDPSKTFLQYKKTRGARFLKDADPTLTVSSLVKHSPLVYWCEGEVEVHKKN